MVSVDFLVTALVVVLIPATGVLYTVSTGLARGARSSLWAALGCTIGIVPHLLASVFGLAAVMHLSALTFQLLKWAGVLYLLYLAWVTWRDTGRLDTTRADTGGGARRLVVRGILLNTLNPKLSIFFLAFLPQFVAPDAPDPLAQMAGLSAIFMAMTLAVFIVYGLLAHAMRRHVLSSARVQNGMRRSFAAAFAALGLNLALAER